MLKVYNKIKKEKIKKASSKNNILYIFTDKEDYELSIDFLDDYDVFAELSRFADPEWGIRKRKAS